MILTAWKCAILLLLAMPTLASAQAWVPPIGIPHPGGWFLMTTGTVHSVTTGGTSRTFSGTGTASNPVIFRGVGNPQFTGTVTITGTYVIVEGIHVNGGDVSIGGNHVMLRNSDVHNSSSGTAVCVNDGSTDVVIHQNRIHDNGNWTSTTENDRHGVGCGGNSHRIWILENELFHNSGDSVQFGHNAQNTLSHIYVGRNVMHHDRENAVDIKEASNVIVSQNTMYGYRPTSSSEGAAVVVHYCPINFHLLFNRIYDSEVAVSSSSLLSRCPTPVTIRIIGNVIHDSGGIQGWGSGKITAVVNNTLYNSGGMSFSNMAAGSVIENNILWDASGTATIDASGTVMVRNNLADTADPLFVNPGAGDFHLRSTSPAIDAGVASSVYPAFQDLFGLAIELDRDGVARPQGRTWDLGAYESGTDGGAGGAPAPPTNLIVR
jgi:hypothetical protein